MESNSVVNYVKVGDKKITQTVTLEESLGGSDGTLIDFKGQLPQGDAIKSTSIFSVVKEGDSYKIKLHIPNIFTDKNGNPITNTEIAKDLDELTLNIEPGTSAQRPISISSKAEQMVVKVKSKDGKDYEITTSATGINIKYGEEVYSYSTKNEHCIDVNMKKDVIEAMLNDENDLIQTPRTITEMPSYLLYLYTAKLDNNASLDFGKYNINMVDFKGSSPAPYVLVTQTNQEGGKSTYLFTDGACKRVREYFFQYNPETQTQRLVLSTGGTKKPLYYAIDLQTEEVEIEGKTEKVLSKENCAFIQSLANNGVKQRNNASAKNRIGQTIYTQDASGNVDKRKIISYQEDVRDYTAYRYINKPRTYDASSKEASFESNGDAYFYDLIGNLQNVATEYKSNHSDIDPTLNGILADINDLYNKVQDIHNNFNGVNNNYFQVYDQLTRLFTNFDNYYKSLPDDKKEEVGPLYNNVARINDSFNTIYKDQIRQSQSGESGESEKDEEEKSEEEQEDAPKTDPIYPKIDLKKPVETISNAITSLGLLMFIAALIPGVGPILASLGTAFTVIGMAGTVYADKFIWDPYKKAEREYKQFKSLEEEFIERENELDLLHENTLEKFAEVDKLVQNELENGGNAVAKQFAEAYNQYGATFANVNPQERFKKLQSMDGYSIRQDRVDENGNVTRPGLLTDMRMIGQETDPKVKNQLIDKFIDGYFKDVPQEERAKISEMFDEKNQPQLVEFLTAMQEAHTTQGKERELLRRQKFYLNAVDNENDTGRIERLVGHTGFDVESRKRFFERYGDTILKFYSAQEGVSFNQIEELLQKVPEGERDDIYQIMIDKQKELSDSFETIKTSAKEQAEIVGRLHDQEAFAEILSTTVNTDEHAAQIENYLSEYTMTYFDRSEGALAIHGLGQEVNQDLLSENDIQLENTINQYVQTIWTGQEPVYKNTKNPYPTNYAAAVEELYKAGQEFGLATDLLEIEERGKVDISSLIPTPGDTPRRDNSYPEVAKRFADQYVRHFERIYEFKTNSKQEIVSISRKNANGTTQPLDPKNENLLKEYQKYQNAQKVISAYEIIAKNEQFKANYSDVTKLIQGVEPVIKDSEFDSGYLKEVFDQQFPEYRAHAPKHFNDKEIENIVKTLIRIELIRQQIVADYEKLPREERDEEKLQARLSVYNKAETYLNCIITGKVNSAFIASTYRRILGRETAEERLKSLKEPHNEDKFEKAERTLEETNRKRQEWITKLEALPIEDQDAINDFIAQGVANGRLNNQELQNEALIKVLGERKVENNGPTYMEYYSAHCENPENIQSVDLASIRTETERREENIAQRYYRVAHTTDEILCKGRHGQYGNEFIDSEFASYNTRGEKPYETILDMLVDRMGVDRDKFIEQMVEAQRRDKNITPQVFINNILNKFGLNPAEYQKGLRYVRDENQVFDFINGLSDEDKARAKVLEDKHKLDEYREKAGRLTSLWEEVKIGTGIVDFANFCRNAENSEFFEFINHNPERMLEDLREIVLPDSPTADDLTAYNAKIARLETKHGNYQDITEKAILKRENEIKKVENNLNFKQTMKSDIDSLQDDLAKFKTKSEDFIALWEKVKTNTDNKGFVEFLQNPENKEFLSQISLEDDSVTSIISVIDGLPKEISSDEELANRNQILDELDNAFELSSSPNYSIERMQEQINYKSEMLLAADNPKKQEYVVKKYDIIGINGYKAKADIFNALWANLRTQPTPENIEIFRQFITSENNAKFIQTLKLPKSEVLNEATGTMEEKDELLQFLDTLEENYTPEQLSERIRSLSDFDKSHKINKKADEMINEQESELDTLEKSYLAVMDEERKQLDVEQKVNKFDRATKEFNDKLEAIMNLPEDQIDFALRAYALGNVKALNTLGIKLEDAWTFSANDQKLLKRLGVDKDLLIGIDINELNISAKNSMDNTLNSVLDSLSGVLLNAKDMSNPSRKLTANDVQKILVALSKEDKGTLKGYNIDPTLFSFTQSELDLIKGLSEEQANSMAGKMTEVITDVNNYLKTQMSKISEKTALLVAYDDKNIEVLLKALIDKDKKKLENFGIDIEHLGFNEQDLVLLRKHYAQLKNIRSNPENIRSLNPRSVKQRANDIKKIFDSITKKRNELTEKKWAEQDNVSKKTKKQATSNNNLKQNVSLLGAMVAKIQEREIARKQAAAEREAERERQHAEERAKQSAQENENLEEERAKPDSENE